MLPGCRMTATLGTLGDNAKTFILDPPCLLNLFFEVLKQRVILLKDRKPPLSGLVK